MFFADDLILFGEASVDQMRIFKDFLGDFCEWSCKKINFEKSKIMFSTNVDPILAQEIANLAAIPYTTNMVII